jgi:beta-glucosidase
MNNKLKAGRFLLFFTFLLYQQAGHTQLSTNKKVEDILARMTLEEKVGQMTNLTIDAISSTDVAGKISEPHSLDVNKLKDKILVHHVGSFQNVAGHGYDREHWYEIITAIQNMAKQSRLKIPALYGIDAIHGVSYTNGSTLFPQQIGMAATFNTALIRRVGEISAYETRASYIPWNFSPVLDLAKTQLWPRIYESFGEDPLLISRMGAAIIEGYQGKSPADKYHVLSTMKHFLGYGAPLSGNDRTPAWIPDRYMREYFLPPFITAVKTGARTVMINSAEINGVPVHASKYLLTDVLRGELKFDGVVISDWMDVRYLHTRHRIVPDEKEAVALAVNSGIDMCIVPYDYTFTDYLIQSVREGKVSVKRIDEAVRRILRLKFEAGLFDQPVGNPGDYPDFGSPAFAKVNRETAGEAITLLKNINQILPLKSTAKILVTGPTAHSMNSLNGGWSYTWQGDQSDQFAKGHNTILEAIQLKAGNQQVVYEPGATYDSLLNPESVLAAARDAEVIVLCLGEKSYTENVGNINDLNLPPAQMELADQLSKTGKPIVLVLAEGRPRIVTRADKLAAATLLLYFPGNEGGNALADILFGDIIPSGKLPFTYPRYPNTLLNYYRKNLENGNPDDRNGYNPLYEFGTGLSYSSFNYNNLTIGKPSFADNEVLDVSVEVTNTGKWLSKETVLLFTSDLYASIAPDTKRLRDFSKIELKPGETKVVHFSLTASDLAFINSAGKSVTEPGEFVIQIADQKKTVLYRTTNNKKLNVEGRL